MTTPTPSPHSPGPGPDYPEPWTYDPGRGWVLDARGNPIIEVDHTILRRNGESPKTVCADSIGALIANAPETARLLRELAAKVQELGYFRQANLREIEECGTPAEVEVATSELAMWETEFTPLLTQIEGLGGGA